MMSLFFNVTSSLWTAFCAILFLPLGMSKKYSIYLAKLWANGMLFLLHKICNIKPHYNIKLDEAKSANLILSKHQSAIETIYLLKVLPNPSFVIKEELLKIPFYGWYLKNMGMIPVSRKISLKELKYMNQNIINKINAGRNVVIFPQGTRVKYNENNFEHKYFLNSLNICKEIDCKIALIALNTGKYWPKGRKLNSGNFVIQAHKTYHMKKNDYKNLTSQEVDLLKQDIQKQIENTSRDIN